MGKQGSILKWIESKKLHLKSIIGVSDCSLAYLLDDTASRTTASPALLADHPHCEELGSIVEEINLYTSHVHPLFAQDNANLYDWIERGLTGTSYSSSIIPFRFACNGKAAMDAVVTKFAGKEVWELRIKEA